MANRYANLVGSNKIKDEWQKINTGFDLVQADMDEKADASDLAILQGTVTNHIGSGGNAHAEATDQQAGFMSAADKQKLDGIETGAEVNQNAFARVNDVEASDPSDELIFEGGTGITITTNPNEKKVIFTATGTSTPGPHGSSHTEHGADPIPNATISEGGLMSAEDKQSLEALKGLPQEVAELKAETTANIGAIAVQSLSNVAGHDNTVPRFEKYVGNPIFTQAQSGLSTIYWPWILRVDTILDNPLGKYYMWFSTNHDAGAGGIGLAYADSLTGPWTAHANNPIYVDTAVGVQTETPSVIWNEKVNQFYMYYHQAGVGIGQSTCLATSSDGINWTRYGMVLDVPNSTDFPGDGHTGYFRPFRLQNRWFGYHLMGGGNYPHFGISYSNDGKLWHIDPRPLGYNSDFVGDNGYRTEWNVSNIIEYKGRMYWIGMISNFTSGGGAKDSKIVMAQICPDFRTFQSPYDVVIEGSEAWESTNIQTMSTFVDDGKIYIIYQCDDKFGIAYSV